MSFFYASYQVKTKKNGQEWDIQDQAAQYFFSLGDCLAWLNDRFNIACKSFKNREGFVSWIIRDENSFYNGLFQISDDNFLEKILSLDTIKQKLENFKNESD